MTPTKSARARLLALAVALAAIPLAGACTSKQAPDAESGPGTVSAQDVASIPVVLGEDVAHGLPDRTVPDEPAPEAAAPFSLTSTDGTGLKIVSLTARAVVEEPLAFTELHLTFENPEDRTIEGRFTIEMPPEAAISRFAMKIGDRWQEGEVVERQAARVAFEDFLHRKQDPALLENEAGNQFSARVFPIPARGRKELIVAYSQELTSGAEPYRLMLNGLPRLEQLDARIVVHDPTSAGGSATSIGGASSTQRVIEVVKKDHTPTQDLEVRAEHPRVNAGVRHQNLAMARVRAVGDMPPDPVDALTILFDTSASRGLGFSGQVKRLGELVTALRDRGDFELRVLCFDQELAAVYQGPASGFGKPQLDKIYSRRPFGASDLSAALRGLATLQAPTRRVLIVSDGIPTAGEAELGALTSAARTLGEAGVARIDAMIDGGLQDRGNLEALTTAELQSKGIVIDARADASTIADKLGRATLSGVRVEIPGSRWVWPAQLDGVQPGDEVLVYADLPEETAMKVVLTGADTIEAEIPLVSVERPLLERAWVSAKIERLTANASQLAASDKARAGEIRQEIIDLSTKYRVLSDFTALLVLETEWDYQRFKIDRNALTDILTVGSGGVELLHRSSAAPKIVVDEPEEAPTPDRTVTAMTTPEEDEAGGTGQRHKGEEGRMGRPSSSSRSGLYAMRGPSDAVPQMARNFDPDMAANQAGILGVMQQESGHFLASPYGGAFAVGNDDEDVWGGLTGTEVGEAYGVGGLGLVGTGRGGGGTGDEGTIGLGNTGLIGRGAGGGTGSGYGRGSGAGFGGRGRRVPMVRQARADVQGALDKDIIRRIVRAHINEIRHCYNQGLVRDPNLRGRVVVDFTIDGDGRVSEARKKTEGTTLTDDRAAQCMVTAVRRWRFPRPQGGGKVRVSYPFVLEPGDASPPTPARDEGFRPVEPPPSLPPVPAPPTLDKPETETPYTGELAEIMALIKSGDTTTALARGLAWYEQKPGDVMALVGIGEALEAREQFAAAARVYGSIIDLFPSRTDLRRYAGARLERLGEDGLGMAIDTYRQAVEQRPDHPSSHRLLAYALVRAGQHEQAFEAIAAGSLRSYPSGRFAGVDRILNEDVGLIGAAWLAADPKQGDEIRRRVAEAGAILATTPSTRFVLNWETDSNDVDFHIRDGQGGHAWYSSKSLPSGGELYADVTTGYGPECFTIPGAPSAYPYSFQAHYYSRGPMGYGMGKLQIVQHDGKGKLSFEDRPFVIMKDRAYLDLGTFDAPL